MGWKGEAVARLEKDVNEAFEVLFWKRLLTSNLAAFGWTINRMLTVRLMMRKRTMSRARWMMMPMWQLTEGSQSRTKSSARKSCR